MLGFLLLTIVLVSPIYIIGRVMMKKNRTVPTLGVVFISIFYTLLLVALLEWLNVMQAPVVASTAGVLSFFILTSLGKIVEIDKSEYEQENESVIAKKSQTERPITKPETPKIEPINRNQTTVKTLSYRNNDEENSAIDINFLVNNESDIRSEKFFTNKTQAEQIASKLDKLYPRLTFWVEDTTNSEDPFAPYQIVIKAKIV